MIPSSYLFILAKEIRSLNLIQLVNEGKIQPNYRSPSSSLASHVLFVNDILVFFRATTKSSEMIINLSMYQSLAGQYFNLEKN